MKQTKLILKDKSIVFLYENNAKEISFPANVYLNSIIKNERKFCNIIKKSGFHRPLFARNISVVNENKISQNDIKEIKNIFSEFGYMNIKVSSIEKYINLNKKSAYIVNDILYYIDNYNHIRSILLDRNVFSLLELKLILLNRLKRKDIYIIDTSSYIKRIIHFLDLEYYLYQNEYFYKKIYSKNVC